MQKSHICWLFVDLFLILASLGLIITSIVTDYWYEVDASAIADVAVQKNFSYTFGMWRKCYKMGLPEGMYLWGIYCFTNQGIDDMYTCINIIIYYEENNNKIMLLIQLLLSCDNFQLVLNQFNTN